MTPISVVIITKNEADSIARCIKACRLISDDIIVVDNESTDGTASIAFRKGCYVYHEDWDGYGANKNKGIYYAKHDWILSIDADEMPDEELIRDLRNLTLHNREVVYDIAFKSYYGKKPIRFGAWGRDHHIRLFNRQLVRWNEPPVHESLILSPVIKVKKLKGHIHHFSVKDNQECSDKTVHYAKLSAEKYFLFGERGSLVKLYLAPAFHFFKNYIIFLGFLDGREGWQIARSIARHTFLKYRLLQKLTKSSYPESHAVKDNLVVEY
ncbi:glycosyltransferase family 2 protein [Mucilaginibacter sp.]|jgi:glycosyltransferase involved in cell wall biosynthesis|uniref:glycosyltransferase family 2 protein n=1 Tax=Mucilaginibacter sp. TaxID=1882438 RepID=UPI002C4E47FA|nr:glycosyltransferase family 2 protein [Mucilaginibacter sp.]HTI58387.1 glycosyltransferase family 2 protein [Mucilaginibacter sp.]